MGRSWRDDDERPFDPKPGLLEQLRVWWRRTRVVEAPEPAAPEPAPETT